MIADDQLPQYRFTPAGKMSSLDNFHDVGANVDQPVFDQFLPEPMASHGPHIEDVVSLDSNHLDIDGLVDESTALRCFAREYFSLSR